MKKYKVTLIPEEREYLKKMISTGKAAARKLTHARILLKADESEGGEKPKDEDIGKALCVNVRTVERVRERFVEEGFDAALVPRPHSRTKPKKIDGENEAHLIALVCGDPPAGRSKWTMRLLADKMVELRYVDPLSGEAVRKALKKRTEALAEKGMVHSPGGERRICLQ
jgi:transposase